MAVIKENKREEPRIKLVLVHYTFICSIRKENASISLLNSCIEKLTFFQKTLSYVLEFHMCRDTTAVLASPGLNGSLMFSPPPTGSRNPCIFKISSCSLCRIVVKSRPDETHTFECSRGSRSLIGCSLRCAKEMVFTVKKLDT